MLILGLLEYVWTKVQHLLPLLLVLHPLLRLSLRLRVRTLHPLREGIVEMLQRQGDVFTVAVAVLVAPITAAVMVTIITIVVIDMVLILVVVHISIL